MIEEFGMLLIDPPLAIDDWETATIGDPDFQKGFADYCQAITLD